MNDSQNTPCECGCGQAVSPGARFRHGHWARTRPRTSTAERFWSKVVKRGFDDCWEWRASRGPAGYGWFWDADAERMVLAHRIAYQLAYEPIPSGLFVCHHCDNPPCVNPSHLYVGTQADNMADKTSRDRHARLHGHDNPNAKLTPEQVAEIRDRYTGRYGEQSELGREYGVNASTIRAIVRGDTWLA